MFEEPDEVLARVQDDMRRAQQRAEALPRLQAAIDAIRVSVLSDQRDMTVEVDASGRLTRLEIADAALERGGSRVSADVMALIGTAARRARATTLEATSRLLGDDDPVAQVLKTEVDAAEAGSRGWLSGGPQ